MAVWAIEIVRKIRDKHYEETKNLSVEEQIKFVRDKAKKLQGTLIERQPSPINDRARKST
ncbi:MAG: hypothetical protein A2V86_03395 [Deltaproteobacteria bacterium RBG_16_49_23]|nr:MAG: hypothetical protein A2V86_03395 [Deltaproteobacteria bacterium RBG_16_49_23]